MHFSCGFLSTSLAFCSLYAREDKIDVGIYLRDGSYAVVTGLEVFAECKCFNIRQKDALGLAGAFSDVREGKKDEVNMWNNEKHVGDAICRSPVGSGVASKS